MAIAAAVVFTMLTCLEVRSIYNINDLSCFRRDGAIRLHWRGKKGHDGAVVRQTVIIRAFVTDYVKKNPVSDAQLKSEYDAQKTRGD